MLWVGLNNLHRPQADNGRWFFSSELPSGRESTPHGALCPWSMHALRRGKAPPQLAESLLRIPLERKPNAPTDEARSRWSVRACSPTGGRDRRRAQVNGILVVGGPISRRAVPPRRPSTPGRDLSRSFSRLYSVEASVVSSDWLDNVTLPSWRHLPAACRRYGHRDCPGVSWTLH
jgi:hypothetical protein